MLFWLFLRMNDWVAQVRDAAGEVLDDYMEGCSAIELMESLPAFERLRAGRRRTESRLRMLEEKIERKLSCMPRENPLEISGMEPAARGALYKIAVRGNIWNLDEMEFCLTSPNGWSFRIRYMYSFTFRKLISRCFMELIQLISAWSFGSIASECFLYLL